MLHGCGQDAEQFACVTRMAERAGAYGAWVLFPEQLRSANRHACWNWFEPAHQGRGAGEPAILAGLMRKLVRLHHLDPHRVFVAGLSAGAAMAVILGRTYPDLVAAVGSVAGMPYGAARTAATALLAMRGRHRSDSGLEAALGLPGRPVRTLVLQGDRDRVVVPKNAARIAAAALAGCGPTIAEQETGTVGGRSVTRVRHRSAEGTVAVEQWTVHGAGHVWVGGGPGAFSDPRGPDASEALLVFFLGQKQAGRELPND
jgi:poly(hydroxyalkanoate) depolymerase family esterase